MKLIKTLTFQLIFLHNFYNFRIVIDKFFPEYSQNQTFKKNFKINEGVSRISKSKIQHFQNFKNFQIRSKKIIWIMIIMKI